MPMLRSALPLSECRDRVCTGSLVGPEQNLARKLSGEFSYNKLVMREVVHTIAYS